MIEPVNDILPKSTDSFYDDTSLISEVHIATSKVPVHHQQSQSSDSSDHDITDVSSIDQEHQHSFHLDSMRHVLFGLSTPDSRLSSLAYPHQQQSMKKHTQKYSQPPYIHSNKIDHYRIRLTSSAINRQKQQQEIERENLKILQRLRHIRPSRNLKRDELLSNYDRQMSLITYTIPSHLRPPSRPSSVATISSTHLSNNSTVRSRPVSANSRSSSVRRPIWNDRWQQQE